MKELTPEQEAGFDIRVNVIKQTGFCAAGYQVGDEILFTGHCIQGKTCIHALIGQLPKVLAMKYGASFPWNDEPDTSYLACPDAFNPVVFEFHRERK